MGFFFILIGRYYRLGNARYDSEKFWDQRALHADSYEGAVGHEDALRNRCIDRIQTHTIEKAFLRLKKEIILDNKKLLDFGCGTGRWVEYFKESGFVYYGVDLSQQMVNIVQSRYPNGDFRKINENLPFPDNYFDVVVSVAVLHHNQYEVQCEIIDDINRVLKSPGYFLIFEGIGERAGTASSPFYYRNTNEWKSVFEERGLTCIWSKSTRYWPIRSIFDRISRPVLNNGSGRLIFLKGILALFERVTLLFDIYLGPLLVCCIPQKKHTRLFMILTQI